MYGWMDIVTVDTVLWMDGWMSLGRYSLVYEWMDIGRNILVHGWMDIGKYSLVDGSIVTLC